jgi:uncharacterized membrane protein YgcG
MAADTGTAGPAAKKAGSTGTTAGKPPAKKGGLSLSNPWVWIGVLGIAVIAGAYFLWREHENSASSSTSGTSDAGTATAAGTAASPANSDAGALDTLQTEIGNLQSSAGQVTVPNTVGMTAAEATNAIKTVDLDPVNPKGTPAGNIVSATSPAAGTQVNSGATVDITSAPKGSSSSSSSGGSTSATSGGSTGSTSSGGGGSTSSSGGTPGSWTDTGQKESADQLAKALGIPETNLKASNGAGVVALGKPTADIPDGAKFTFLKPS